MNDNLTANVYAILKGSNDKLHKKRERLKKLRLSGKAHRSRNDPNEHTGVITKTGENILELQREIRAESDRAIQEAITLCNSHKGKEADSLLGVLKVYCKYAHTPKAEQVLYDIFKDYVEE